MKILADENIPLMTVQALREMGHDLLDVRSSPNKGASDEILWDLAQKEKRLVITTDMGFAQQRSVRHHGMLIVRLKQPNRHKIHERVLEAVTGFAPEEWPSLLVIMQDRVRRIWRSR